MVFSFDHPSYQVIFKSKRGRNWNFYPNNFQKEQKFLITISWFETVEQVRKMCLNERQPENSRFLKLAQCTITAWWVVKADTDNNIFSSKKTVYHVIFLLCPVLTLPPATLLLKRIPCEVDFTQELTSLKIFTHILQVWKRAWHVFQYILQFQYNSNLQTISTYMK